MKKKYIGIVVCLGIMLSGCSSSNTPTKNADAITLAKAKEIALQEETGEVIKEQEEYDDGRLYFEIEIVRDHVKYDFEISDAGKIISKEQEPYGNFGGETTPSTEYITSEKAKDIAITHAGGGTILSCELDTDDRVAKYEIELLLENKEYDMVIDAITGEVLLFQQDY